MTEQLTSETICPWSLAPTVLDVAADLPWIPATPLDVSAVTAWSKQDIRDAANVMPWARLLGMDLQVLSPWVPTGRIDPDFLINWAVTGRPDASSRMLWSEISPTDMDLSAAWARMHVTDFATRAVWSAASVIDRNTSAAWAGMHITDPAMIAPWERLFPMDLSVFQNSGSGIGTTEYQAMHLSTGLPWLAVARIIMSKQNIIFKRVSDDAPVHIINPSAAIDLESYLWQFSGTLPSKADADLIRPGADGNRETEVYLSINGYEFKFWVKSVPENYQWAKGTYSFTGRSKSVVFGDEYCPKITQIFDADPIQSVVADVLQDTGWTWDWDLLTNTWNLDAGSLSVTDATKMDVLALIARAVGGTIQTDPAENVLRFMSRMPVSPENWAAADVDATILSGIMSQGVEAAPTPGYNQIIVSGKETGVIGTIRRTGTAGDVPAPSIIDPLLTNQAVITERGRVELAETGFDFIDETLLLPLPAAGSTPALLLPGYLVQVTDLFTSWRGQVAGVAIAAETAKTRQRVIIKRLRD